MMAKPMKTLELHYPVVQFFLIIRHILTSFIDNFTTLIIITHHKYPFVPDNSMHE